MRQVMCFPVVIATRYRHILLAVLVLLATAVPAAQAQPEPGWVVANAIVFRLYTDSTDTSFGCTGFYWRPWIDDDPRNDLRRERMPDPVAGAWYLSAGHCTEARYIRVYSRVWFVIRPIVAVQWKGADFMVGRGGDFREKPQKAVFAKELVREPQSGEVHLTIGFATHGFASHRADGESLRGSKRLQALTFLRVEPTGVYVYRSSSWPIGGNSGSPVLTKSGELVGILWGYYLFDPSIVYVTPIRAIREYAPWAGH